MFMTTNFFIMLAIVVYLAIMLVIGFVYSKRNNSTEDFYLGGRKMGPLVTAMSAEASDMSSWLLMGLPGVAYLSGICDAAWTAIGLAVGTWLNWFFVSRKLRRYSNNIGAITVPDFFAKRFHDKNNVITALSALVIIIFFIPYTASGFAACGKLFNSLFGINYQVAMMLSALLIVGYTITGGFNAVCVTDLVQSIVMTGALAIVLIYGISRAGGWTAVMDNAAALPGYLSLTSTFDVASGSEVKYNFLTIFSTAAWGLGYFGMPHILVRFMSIKSSSMIKKSRRIAIVWVIITLVASVAVGVLGYVYLFQTEGTVLEGAASETIFMVLVQRLTPGFIAGILLCAIVAAIMSSSDSQMLVTASAISNDIYKTIFRKEATDKELLRVSKIAVIAVAVIAFVLALNPDNSVMNLVSYAWAGLGAAFGPAMILSLYWKRMTMKGALAGMVSGGLGVLFWNTCLTESSPIFGSKFVICDTGLYELVPAFILSVVVIVVVSLIDKKPSQQVYDEFNRVCTENFD